MILYLTKSPQCFLLLNHVIHRCHVIIYPSCHNVILLIGWIITQYTFVHTFNLTTFTFWIFKYFAYCPFIINLVFLSWFEVLEPPSFSPMKKRLVLRSSSNEHSLGLSIRYLVKIFLKFLTPLYNSLSWLKLGAPFKITSFFPWGGIP